MELYNDPGFSGIAAKPGTSMHEFGYAVDIKPEDAIKAANMNLFDKWKMDRPYAKKPTKSGRLEVWHAEPKGINHAKVIASAQTYKPLDKIRESENNVRGSADQRNDLANLSEQRDSARSLNTSMANVTQGNNTLIDQSRTTIIQPKDLVHYLSDPDTRNNAWSHLTS